LKKMFERNLYIYQQCREQEFVRSYRSLSQSIHK